MNMYMTTNMNMKILGKYLAIMVLLGIGITILLQNNLSTILPNPNLEEGLTVSTPGPQKQGLYTMTNTTYDTNGNIIVKTIDTSGNFNVNTYGSSVLNTKKDQQSKYQQVAVNPNTPNYQTQFYPPVTNQSNPAVEGYENRKSSDQKITANQISTMTASAISAVADAYKNTP